MAQKMTQTDSWKPALQKKLKKYSNKKLWRSWAAAMGANRKRGPSWKEIHEVYLMEFRKRKLFGMREPFPAPEKAEHK